MTKDHKQDKQGEMEPGPQPKEKSNLPPEKEKEREREKAVFDQMQETPEQVKQRVANETIDQKPADYDTKTPADPSYQGVAPIRPPWPPIDELKTAMPDGSVSPKAGKVKAAKGRLRDHALDPSLAPDLHGDGTWPGDDQAGSAGPPPGFEPPDPDAIPDPVVPPTDPAYVDVVSDGPPAGFEPPDPDAPPPPVIEPTDPLYQGPDAVTPPGFEEPEAPWEPGGEKPPEPPPPETLGATLAKDTVEPQHPLV